MNIKEFKKIITSDLNINKLQNRIQEFVKPLTINPLLNGVIKQDVAMSSGSNTIAHGLGKKPNGWLILKKSANADIWEDPSNEYLPNKNLILDTDATVTITIYIF